MGHFTNVRIFYAEKKFLFATKVFLKSRMLPLILRYFFHLNGIKRPCKLEDVVLFSSLDFSHLNGVFYANVLVD